MSIKLKRKNKGYSQSEVASILGIPLRTYKRIELSEENKHSYKHELIEAKVDALPKNLVRRNIKKETIGVVGAGNVGYPFGILLAERNRVFFVDSSEEKMLKINKGISLVDGYQLSSNALKVKASSDIKTLNYCDSIVICLPTEYEEKIKRFNTLRVV